MPCIRYIPIALYPVASLLVKLIPRICILPGFNTGLVYIRLFIKVLPGKLIRILYRLVTVFHIIRYDSCLSSPFLNYRVFKAQGWILQVLEK